MCRKIVVVVVADTTYIILSLFEVVGLFQEK